jgi:hypothetical protein
VPITLNRERPSLPSSDQIEEPHVPAAVEAWTKARESSRLASQDAVALEQTRESAVEQDREKYADALERGKGDPGTPATDAHDAKISDAQRRAEASKVVEDRARLAMFEAVEEFGDDWAMLAEQRLLAVRAEWVQAVDVLAEKHADVAQALSVSLFTRTGRPLTGASSVPLRRSNEPRAGVPDLLAALRTLGESPAQGTPTTLRSVGKSAAA